MRLELARELGCDWDVARAPLTLGLLLPIKQPMAASDADDRVAVELEVAPPDGLELGDPQTRLCQEAYEQAILGRQQRSKQSRELLDREMAPLRRVAARRR